MAVQRQPPPQPVTCRSQGTEGARACGCLLALNIKHPCYPIPVCCCNSIAKLLPGREHNFIQKVYTRYTPCITHQKMERYIPGIYHIYGISSRKVYTWYIPDIWLTFSYDRYIPGIYHIYDWCCHMSSIYLVYTMIITFQGIPDEYCGSIWNPEPVAHSWLEGYLGPLVA